MKILEYCQFRHKNLKQFCEENNKAALKRKERPLYKYGYMRQISSGHVIPSPRLAFRIEQDTEGMVTRLELLYPKNKK